MYTWTVCRRAFHPAFEKDLPYAVAVVAMEEGPRVVAEIVDLAPDRLRLEMPVEVVFEKVAENVVLPKFRAIEYG